MMIFRITAFKVVANCELTSTDPRGKIPPELIPPNIAGEQALEGTFALNVTRLEAMRALLLATRISAENIDDAKTASLGLCQSTLLDLSQNNAGVRLESDISYKPLGGGQHSLGFWIYNGDAPYEFTIHRTYGTRTHDYRTYAMITILLTEV